MTGSNFIAARVFRAGIAVVSLTVVAVSYLGGFLSGTDVGIVTVLASFLLCAFAVWPTRPSRPVGLMSLSLAIIFISVVVAYDYLVYPFMQFD